MGKHLLIHDYGGYSFSVQLSRELSRRGNQVLYLYGESTQLVRRGAFQHILTDPDTLRIKGINLSKPFRKYSFIKRRSQEIEYGHRLSCLTNDFQPDIVISADSPLDVQSIVLKRCKKSGAKFIYWLQDAVGLATYMLLNKKSNLLGNSVGRYYTELEGNLVRQSDAVIIISEDFQPLIQEWGVEAAKTYLIPNWAPVEEIPPGLKNNPWAQQHALADKFCFLYSGVLGMKHNPELLLKLAEHWRSQESVRVVVVSEGPGADWLKHEKCKLNLENLSIINFQTYEVYPSVLAAADVLVSILNPDAGLFSVPSKVLTYLCAQRPVLLAVPEKNLVARVVNRNQTGLVVDPNNTEAFLNAATCLYENEALRAYYAKNGRQYAEKHFGIKQIADQFEQVLL